jgi:hypothetical protein
LQQLREPIGGRRRGVVKGLGQLRIHG